MVLSSTPDQHSRGKMVREILHSFKRAGADIIVSYHARPCPATGLNEVF